MTNQQIYNFIDKNKIDIDFKKDVFFDKTKELFYIVNKWSKVFNISNFKDYVSFLDKNLSDSLIIYNDIKKHSFVDIGSGGGILWMFIKLLGFNNFIYSIDKNRKKISFQNYVINTFNFDKVITICNDFNDIQEFDIKQAKFLLIRAIEKPSINVVKIINRFKNKHIIFFVGAKTKIDFINTNNILKTIYYTSIIDNNIKKQAIFVNSN